MQSRILKIKKSFQKQSMNKSGCYSFLNFASLSKYFENGHNEMEYYCDGILMSTLITILTRTKVERVSFDFSSIAGVVFEHALNSNLKIGAIGGTDEENNEFTNKIVKNYQGINFTFHRGGFFSPENQNSIIRDIIISGVDILIVGLGAGKQEEFIILTNDAGFNGVSFSCGGFIRQEASCKTHYYPRLIDKFNLRSFYRMYKEPHTIKRYFINYPINFILFVYYIAIKKIRVEIVN